jgi:hypothetical protein
MSEKAVINWTYSGKADYLLGNGATVAEQALVWVAGLAGLGLYGYLYLTHALGWAWWQYLIAALIAFDILGGIVANNLNSCKRFYHTLAKPGELSFAKNHLAFSALHIYPLLAWVLFDTSKLFYGVFWYVFLMGGTFVILKTPLYLRRPAAFLAIALALLLNLYVISPVHGFEWLTPGLFIKILYGHLVQEEPYRPVNEALYER